MGAGGMMSDQTRSAIVVGSESPMPFVATTETRTEFDRAVAGRRNRAGRARAVLCREHAARGREHRDPVVGDRRVVEMARIPAHRDLLVGEAARQQVRDRLRTVLDRDRDRAPHVPCRVGGRVGHLVLEVDVAGRCRCADRDAETAVVGAWHDVHARGKVTPVEAADVEHPHRLAWEGVARLVVGEHVDRGRLTAGGNAHVRAGLQQGPGRLHDGELDAPWLALARDRRARRARSMSSTPCVRRPRRAVSARTRSARSGIPQEALRARCTRARRHHPGTGSWSGEPGRSPALALARTRAPPR